MKNPGLSAFSGPTMTHPRWGDINDDVDPDRRIDEDDTDEFSDYTPGVNFGRWRNPGQSIRVPGEVGPSFAPGEMPEDVIHGEVVSPEEHASAERILHGEHESDVPSDNPDVEQARQDLHTPAAGDAVATVSGLLSGGSPEEVGGLDEAHDYLSHHFTGVSVNPHHGTLVAHSPAGTQVARRHVAQLPAIMEHPEEAPEKHHVYSLTNKHGTFESDDPKNLVRAMVAFQIVHNEHERRKREEEEQQSGLVATSAGFWRRMRDEFQAGLETPSKKWKPPQGAIFEPGSGTDRNHKGQLGGWVAPTEHAPDHWHHGANGVSYSPGHAMGDLLDPERAKTPHPDPYHHGHTYTYAPNHVTGHTIERFGGGMTYYVTKLHPAARGGLDVPPSKTGGGEDDWDWEEPPARRTPTSPPAPPVAPKPPASLPSSDDPYAPVPVDYTDEDLPSHPTRADPDDVEERRRRYGAVQMNDLCPVCASGYLESYDDQFHECLNCGSLVKHIGFDKKGAASRKPGGLGRGLGQIRPVEGDPLSLGTGGSEAEDFKAPETSAVHPLADEEDATPEDERYRAGTELREKGQVRRREAAFEGDLDEHMGKLGFQPLHRPGEADRAYLARMPGVDGGYIRLTEGVPHPKTGQRAWALTADHIPRKEMWEREGEPIKSNKIDMEQPGRRSRKHQLPDVGERIMPEKSFLAGGTHPIDDDSLNRAIRDVVTHGRDSRTYQDAVMDTAFEPKQLPTPGEGMSQRDLRGYSSTNPGLVRWGEA